MVGAVCAALLVMAAGGGPGTRIELKSFAGKQDESLARTPESIGIPNAMRMCLDFMGRSLEPKPITAHGMQWRLDETYTLLMAVTGESFRFWDTLYSYRADDLTKVFRGGFDAFGLDHELVLPDACRKAMDFRGTTFRNEAELAGLISAHIGSAGRPVILLECGESPDWRLVTGVDQGGKVLLCCGGDLEAVKFAPGSARNPVKEMQLSGLVTDCGPWVLLVGDKKDVPEPSQVYLATLKYGLELLRAKSVNGKPAGFEAYGAWSTSLLDDSAYPAGDESVLKQRFQDFYVASEELAERRWYGHNFLQRAREQFPAASDDLRAAAECFHAEHDLVWEMWALTEKDDSHESHQKLASHETREKIAALIGKARRKDAEAAEHIELGLQRLAG